MTKAKNVVWHHSQVSRQERYRLNQHKSAVLWFTGLSGAGKSTISAKLDKELISKGIRAYQLDGDNIRHGLNSNLGFSPQDRSENIRRIGEVAKLMVDAGLFTLTAFISPYQKDRDQVRELFEVGEFIEIYVKAKITTCEARDPKGLYKKARNGEIKDFTGIDAPYEEPVHPELIIDTDQMTLDESVECILHYLSEKGYFHE